MNELDPTAPRAPLVRLRRFTVGALGDAEREAIVDETYAIFGIYFAGHDRETFRRIAMHSPETRLALLQTRAGATAGFATMNIDRLTLDGRVHAAVSASVFVRPGYRGGTFAAAFLLSEILAFRLRNPGVPLGYLGCVLGPTTYQRFARFFPRTYPNRRDGFPPETARIARTFLEARGLRIEGAAPGIVNLGARPLRTARITPARASDPDVQYFRSVNPGYTEGHALPMWIPIDRTTIAQAFWGLFRDGTAEALTWWRGRARAGALPPSR